MSTITHPEMVKGLAKDGHTIIDELTKESAHLLHMAVGIAGEAGELCQAIYSCNEFEDIDKENIVEELGDLEFYLEGLRQGMQLARNQTISMFSDHEFKTSNLTTSVHNAVLLNIECSILLDYVKKSAFYVKPIKHESVIISLMNINNYMAVLRECFDITRNDTIEHNINKLGERYQGHNYSNEQAIKRADKA